MATPADLIQQGVAPSPDLDNIVMREVYTSRDGGATVNFTGYPRNYIRAGHVLIKDGGDIKPLGLNEAGDGYEAVDEQDIYGHAVQTVGADNPLVGVCYHGKFNPEVVDASAGYFDAKPILDDLKEAIPHMIYEGDNAY